MIRPKVNLLSAQFRRAYGDLYYKMPGKLKERDLTATDSLVKTAYLHNTDPYVATHFYFTFNRFTDTFKLVRASQ